MGSEPPNDLLEEDACQEVIDISQIIEDTIIEDEYHFIKFVESGPKNLKLRNVGITGWQHLVSFFIFEDSTNIHISDLEIKNSFIN